MEVFMRSLILAIVCSLFFVVGCATDHQKDCCGDCPHQEHCICPHQGDCTCPQDCCRPHPVDCDCPKCDIPEIVVPDCPEITEDHINIESDEGCNEGTCPGCRRR